MARRKPETGIVLDPLPLPSSPPPPFTRLFLPSSNPRRSSSLSIVNGAWVYHCFLSPTYPTFSISYFFQHSKLFFPPQRKKKTVKRLNRPVYKNLKRIGLWSYNSADRFADSFFTCSIFTDFNNFSRFSYPTQYRRSYEFDCGNNTRCVGGGSSIHV